MLFRKKDPASPNEKKSAAPSGAHKGAKGSAPKVVVRESPGAEKPVARSFPGPRNARVSLRIAVERSAYAELIAHAKESLEVEVCGVLAGEVCEDEEGLFVHVEASLRGTAASQASTHVTFTQATWNAIHQTMEQRYPKLRIIGWYHTHPGFGVEFSDMDLFIQKNFFSGPTQIALVTDPLSGAVAICANGARGIEYLPRFWVDGREQLSRVPGERASQPSGAEPAMHREDEAGKAVQALEARLTQLIQAFDEQRASFHRFLSFIGVVVCLGVVGGVGYFIYSQFKSRNEPPQLNSYVPVPVQVGDKVVMIGVGVAEWQVPPELNAIHLQLEKLKQEAAERAAKAAEAQAAKAAQGSAPTNTPTASNSPPTKPLPANPPPKSEK